MIHLDKPFGAVLCTSCGKLIAAGDRMEVQCPACDANTSMATVDALRNYAAEVIYYGYQYRSIFERSSSRDVPKLSLSFAGEAFLWVAVAMLSGIVGNASYDLVKSVVCRLRDDAGQMTSSDPSYERLASVTDEELERMFEYARDYHDEMKRVSDGVKAQIIEEIISDAVAHDPEISAELMTLMQKKSIKPKHRRKAIELYRTALARSTARARPTANDLNNFWSRRKDG